MDKLAAKEKKVLVLALIFWSVYLYLWGYQVLIKLLFLPYLVKPILFIISNFIKR